jgi:dolichyl-diphosphooligosaccharide--protein glycosyltransferase
VKIFEYVPGATLSGKTSADGDVKVTLNIVTNQGRTFVYTLQTKANNGRYEIKVPYSTQGSKYGIKPTSDYIIQNANTSRAVSVSEEDVMEGKVLQVDLI